MGPQITPASIQLMISSEGDDISAKVSETESGAIEEEDLKCFGLSELATYRFTTDERDAITFAETHPSAKTTFNIAAFEGEVTCKVLDPTVNMEPDAYTGEAFSNAHSIFRNNSSANTTYTASLSCSIATTCSMSWSNTYTRSLGESISVSAALQGVGIAGSKTWTCDNQVGASSSETKEVTIGSENTVTVELEPNKAVKIEHSVTYNRMKIRVPLEISLTGSWLAKPQFLTKNNNRKFRKKTLIGELQHGTDYHDINDILEANGLSKTKIMEMKLDIGFDSTSTAQVIDIPQKWH